MKGKKGIKRESIVLALLSFLLFLFFFSLPKKQHGNALTTALEVEGRMCWDASCTEGEEADDAEDAEESEECIELLSSGSSVSSASSASSTKEPHGNPPASLLESHRLDGTSEPVRFSSSALGEAYSLPTVVGGCGHPPGYPGA